MRTTYLIRYATLALVLVPVMGCAMRVSGMVVDARTHAPVPGAMISANDGRGRVRRSDETGYYSVKTDADTVSMNVSAPGYHSVTAGIPTGTRYPQVQIDLVPLESSRRAEPTLVPVSIVPVPVRNPTAELEELESLYDRGMISPDEYKRMRARIIDGQ
jgi:hypothetical protein